MNHSAIQTESKAGCLLTSSVDRKFALYFWIIVDSRYIQIETANGNIATQTINWY